MSLLELIAPSRDVLRTPLKTLRPVTSMRTADGRDERSVLLSEELRGAGVNLLDESLASDTIWRHVTSDLGIHHKDISSKITDVTSLFLVLRHLRLIFDVVVS